MGDDDVVTVVLRRQTVEELLNAHVIALGAISAQKGKGKKKNGGGKKYGTPRKYDKPGKPGGGKPKP